MTDTTLTGTNDAGYRVVLDIECPACRFPDISGQLPGGSGPRLLCRPCGWSTNAETAVDAVRSGIAHRLVSVLAQQAESGTPKSATSPGGKMLDLVRRDVLDATEGMATSAEVEEWLAERAHELYDEAPSVYTGKRWAEFVDLEAWDQDMHGEELHSLGVNITEQAGEALRRIATTLVFHLAGEISEALDQDDAMNASSESESA